MDAELPTLKLMADYDSFPLWITSEEGFFNVDPAELDLTDDLRSLLEAWSDRYDSTLDRNDPAASGFASDEEESRFVDEGGHLAASVAEQTRGRYRVVYKPEGSPERDAT